MRIIVFCKNISYFSATKSDYEEALIYRLSKTWAFQCARLSRMIPLAKMFSGRREKKPLDWGVGTHWKSILDAVLFILVTKEMVFCNETSSILVLYSTRIIGRRRRRCFSFRFRISYEQTWHYSESIHKGKETWGSNVTDIFDIELEMQPYIFPNLKYCQKIRYHFIYIFFKFNM